ncbi:YagK/YfjJ domain-containing protein [Citrobacter braakii]|uniref:YagK/YfjJ domain-containing protein n=1 Tax=Citrobacter braakii TaxID=57706 RepID=UPI003CC6A5EE
MQRCLTVFTPELYSVTTTALLYSFSDCLNTAILAIVYVFRILRAGLIERFIGALKSRINAHQERCQHEGYQVSPTDLRYVWVREVGQSGKYHYHVAVFVNKDTFNALGDYSKRDNNLGSYISDAWLSALGLLDLPEYRTLVSFTNTPHYLKRLRQDRFERQRQELLSHLGYFAKERTMEYSKEERSFGGSIK